MSRCKDKVALVTGGAAGIGRACAEVLLENGARIVIADIADDRGNALADQLGGAAAYFHLDVRSEDGWEACIQFCTDTHGSLDVLVNNAGIAKIAPDQTPETITLEEWRGVNAINTEGVVLGCKHAIASMRTTGGGSIINMASVAGTMESPLAYPYGASKAAVLQLTKTVAAYCARQDYEIRCNAILPGIIETELYQSTTDTASKRQSLGGVPIGRHGTPSQVANAVLFLASDDSSYVTGVHLPVDGGLTAANPMRSGPREPTR